MALEPPHPDIFQPQDFLQIGPGLTIPAGPLSASELVPLIQGPYAPVYALEILLKKWQPGPEYIEAFLTCLQNPEYCQWISRSGSGGGPTLFKLIEEVIPSEQRSYLTMLLIKAELLSAQRDVDYPHTVWQQSWHAVCNNEDWEEARELLEEDCVISQSVGDVFRDCALVVIAERQLRACMSRLEDLRKYPGPVGNVDSEECREKYLDILRDFRHRDLDVSPWFYKYSLQIIDWNELEDGHESRHKRLELADEYRHRYLKLIDIPPIFDGGYENGTSSAEGAMESEFDYNKRPKPFADTRAVSSDSTNATNATTRQTPDRDSSGSPMSGMGPPSRVSSRPDSPSRLLWKSRLHETREAFDILIEKWRCLSGFKEYAQSILLKDGQGILIFEASPDSAENLFGIIHEKVPEVERVSFTTALLTAFSTIPLTTSYSPWSIVWWNSLHSAPSWEKFQIRLDLPKTLPHLERIMSAPAAKLFVDCTVSLVGERLLNVIKGQMISAKRRKSAVNDAAAAYASMARYQQQYMAILGEFQSRGMRVDQSWVSYLLNIM